MFTVTNLDAVAVQPFDAVTVTVYVLLEVGEKIACALDPPPLLQLYVPPPLAVIVAL